MNQFINGVRNKDTKRDLLVKSTNSFVEAVNMAEKLQFALKKIDEKIEETQEDNIETLALTNKNKDIRKILKRLENIESKLNLRRNYQSNYKCYKCGRIGHFKRNCNSNFNTKKYLVLLFMRIKIFNLEISSIIDSGSQVSLLSSNIIKNLNLVDIRCTNQIIYTAESEKLNLIGKVLLPMELKKKIQNIKFFISSNLTHKCILGLDFMYKFRFKLRVNTKNVFFHGGNNILQNLSLCSYDLESFIPSNVVEHTIDTGVSGPIKDYGRQIPHFRQKIMKNLFEKMLKNGII